MSVPMDVLTVSDEAYDALTDYDQIERAPTRLGFACATAIELIGFVRIIANSRTDPPNNAAKHRSKDFLRHFPRALHGQAREIIVRVGMK